MTVTTTLNAGRHTCPLLSAAMQKTIPCLGHLCMMWRWNRRPDVKLKWCDPRTAVKEPPRPEGVTDKWTFYPYDNEDVEPTEAHWVEPNSEAEARRTGYCGLAGVPDHA